MDAMKLCSGGSIDLLLLDLFTRGTWVVSREFDWET